MNTKILVLGLDGVAPEMLSGDDRLANIRGLIEVGCHGRLAGAIPPDPGLAWACLATGRGPGNPGALPALWDLVERQGGRAVVIGVPAAGAPGEEIGSPGGDAPAAVADATHPGGAEGGRSLDGTRARFEAARRRLAGRDWDYLHYVEPGPGRPGVGPRGHHESRPPSPDDARDACRELDRRVGTLLGLLGDDTVVLLVAGLGARPLGGRVGRPGVEAPGPDACRDGRGVAFVLAAAGLPASGEIPGARLHDLAPTVLDLAGRDVPASMRGRSLVAGLGRGLEAPPCPIDDEQVVRDRLQGLGYIG